MADTTTRRWSGRLPPISPSPDSLAITPRVSGLCAWRWPLLGRSTTIPRVSTAIASHPALRAAPRGDARVGAIAASVGVSLPAAVVTSAELGARLGVGEDWIARRTGIRERRVAAPGERLEHHATAAARDALERAGVPAQDVDLVVVATTTSDELMPGTAPLVAHALGATSAGAFDVGSACTGFLSALAVGTAQIESCRARCVLVIGADFMTRITDPSDRATAAVFADGAGAVVLRRSVGAGRIGPIILGSDGAGADHIRVAREDATIRMRGHETFREAVARLTLCTHQAVRAAGLALSDIDLFVYHQANGRILSAVGDRLGLPAGRVVDCIAEYGNTSAATLPLALAWGEREGVLHRGDRVLLGAFGAGFTWGATVLEWGAETPSPLVSSPGGELQEMGSDGG
jgi:3-oxoacyl-[acyl-carrier-protein] synthase-3